MMGCPCLEGGKEVSCPSPYPSILVGCPSSQVLRSVWKCWADLVASGGKKGRLRGGDSPGPPKNGEERGVCVASQSLSSERMPLARNARLCPSGGENEQSKAPQMSTNASLSPLWLSCCLLHIKSGFWEARERERPAQQLVPSGRKQPSSKWLELHFAKAPRDPFPGGFLTLPSFV
ncbi:hypothetical protein E2320_011810 [Naja naja]|nr:hypothetical protein E2320_011810 [Naja naja]